jgi:hypothetical protein
MTKQNSSVSRAAIALVALGLLGFALPPSARAGDKEFGLLVRYVESHYHAHRSHRFLLGFASFAVNVVRPYGVRGMKLALWENQHFAALDGADADFPDVVHAGLDEGWQPMVRVWSRRSGEHTVVFAKPEGNDMKLLVATVESDEAVVVQMRINPDKLSKCIDEWSHEDKRNCRDRRDCDNHPANDPAKTTGVEVADSI